MGTGKKEVKNDKDGWVRLFHTLSIPLMDEALCHHKSVIEKSSKTIERILHRPTGVKSNG